MRKVMKLKCDVRNPRPDRRHRNEVSAAEMWKAGSLWLYTEWTNHDVPVRVLRCQGMHGDIGEWGHPNQWSMLMVPYGESNLEDFVWTDDRTREQFVAAKLLNKYDPDLLIEYLFAKGVVTRADLDAAQKFLDEMEDVSDIWEGK